MDYKTCVANIMDVMEALYQDTVDSARAFRLFDKLASAELATVAGLSPSRVAQAAQIRGLQTIMQVAAFQQLAQVVMNHDYVDKQSAHDLRFAFAKRGLALQTTLSASGLTDLYNLTSELIALVGQEYENLTDGLKPVAYLTPKTPTSSLALAWNLYQDPTQAADIIDRNDALNGAFLPATVEYLTP